MQLIFQILLALVAIFLILLVLVQRGRGGGLAGALGGMGGSSAFGAKAGDVFTRITVGAAAFWIILCIVAAKLGPTSAGSRLNLGQNPPAATTSDTSVSGEAASAGGEDASAGGEDASAGGEDASAGGEEDAE